ncbi:MAG: ankyrin repeat domain-containing protein [Endozoicomonadaceae bacterium]|nr:ankyrin repeat domain-containing protein [Endozoicomonadaceae bacterium]
MNNDHALLFACEKGEINAVKCLVQTKNASFAFSNYQSLVSSVTYGHLDIVKYILECHPNIDNGTINRAKSMSETFKHKAIFKLLNNLRTN